MAMLLVRSIVWAFAGAFLAGLGAGVAQWFAPQQHLLLLNGNDASGIVLYASVLLGAGFGGVIGAISAAAEQIVAASRRDIPPSDGRKPLG